MEVPTGGHLASRRTEAGEDGPATIPAVHASVKRASAPLAAADVREQIETGVDEGGADDGIAPCDHARDRGRGHRPRLGLTPMTLSMRPATAPGREPS
ncbi:MAG: hypothetical protein ACRYHQ_22180 [Janthinobacterium lividum]